ncbi:hypothetical protein EJ08DRAFT_205538 [Tothia fuscella]|uniref:Uncharacterized protein n=1 Tax=Tothia fuscella TaxID=1048955 RepID=A0A9P4TY22_9PEZI|nr:hypothetical protein EJ08DRAFT_205538 [Tothia fuscella]
MSSPNPPPSGKEDGNFHAEQNQDPDPIGRFSAGVNSFPVMNEGTANIPMQPYNEVQHPIPTTSGSNEETNDQPSTLPQAFSIPKSKPRMLDPVVTSGLAIVDPVRARKELEKSMHNPRNPNNRSGGLQSGAQVSQNTQSSNNNSGAATQRPSGGMSNSGSASGGTKGGQSLSGSKWAP